MHVLCDQFLYLVYDENQKKFVPVSQAETGTARPVFTVRPLNYWQGQVFFKEFGGTDVERMQSALRDGLVAISNDPELARQFCANPAFKLVPPLYQAILDLTMGNSVAGQAEPSSGVATPSV